tara:strand:+ start:21198 stop:21575 length:378 start_codon:yes stop_codon:yes gene_type:complete
MQKISSNRSFGILFFIVFLVIAIWPLKNSEAIRLWPIPFSIIFLILGLINSNLLRPLNIIWVKFGELLGRIIAPIVMGFIYFLIITPIGLIMRIFGKDFLSIKFSKQNSYWINKIKNIGPMNRQF